MIFSRLRNMRIPVRELAKFVATGWLHAVPDIQATVPGSAVEDAHGLTPFGAVLNGNGALWVTGRQALAALTTAMVVSVVGVLVPNHEVMRIQPAAAFCRIV
jgi:hypothetical protein